MTVKHLWCAIIAAFLILDVLSIIIVFGGSNGILEKAVYIIALVLVFLWLLTKFMNVSTDIMLPKTFRRRKIFVEQNYGGYDMERVVESLNAYFTEQGAIIAEESSAAEFVITLRPSMLDLSAIDCQITDKRGHAISLKEYGQYWPRSLALAVSRFIRTSDSSSIRR